jgi:hypothetical protein
MGTRMAPMLIIIITTDTSRATDVGNANNIRAMS